MPYTPDQLLQGLISRQQRANELLGPETDTFHEEAASEFQRLNYVASILDSWIHRCMQVLELPLDTPLTFNPLESVIERLRLVHESASDFYPHAQEIGFHLEARPDFRAIRLADTDLEVAFLAFMESKKALRERLNEIAPPQPVPSFRVDAAGTPLPTEAPVFNVVPDEPAS